MGQLVPVTFQPQGVTVRVPAGTTGLDAALAAAVPVQAPCGGRGTCGKCAVAVLSGDAGVPDDVETRALVGAPEGVRLACRLRVEGPLALRLVAPLEEACVEPGTAAPPGKPLVAAADLGTTTISSVALDAARGVDVGIGLAANPQRAYGADVASRLSAALSGGAAALRDRAVAGLAQALSRALATPGAAERCRGLAVAGNTVMAHLLLGAPLEGLAGYPYRPSLVGAQRVHAADVGLSLLADATELVVMPAISGFVGGDVTAGVLATRLDERHGLRILVDLGTNAEVVVSAEGALTVASAAAGPAFEAAGLTCGGPAAAGAVDLVSSEPDGSLSVRVIGSGEARWLCGSGALSLLVVLLDLGHVSADGRLSAAGPLASRVHQRDGVVAVQLAGEAGGASDVYLTQLDIRELQLAKAAVATALELTLADAGRSFAEVDELLVSGAFGAGVSADVLTRLGVLPQGGAASLTAVGNSSLAGASIVALDPGEARHAEEIAASACALELALHPAFRGAFLRNTGLSAH